MQSQFQPPEVWAAGMTKKHGPKDAARIVKGECRPTYGPQGQEIPNPNLGFFTHALNWIKNRHPKEAGQ